MVINVPVKSLQDHFVNLSHDVIRFAKIAVRVWGCQMDFDNPERTAKEEDIEKMAYTCCYGRGNEGGKIGGFVSLEQKDVEAIYRLML